MNSIQGCRKRLDKVFNHFDHIVGFDPSFKGGFVMFQKQKQTELMPT